MIVIDTSALVDSFTGARTSEIAIAATAIRRGAFLWTLNRCDFDDIPGLRLL